jgi:hypothetical protein
MTPIGSPVNLLYRQDRPSIKAPIISALVVFFCLFSSQILSGQPMMPEPNWDRGMALQTVRETDAQPILKPLFQMARSGSNAKLLRTLSVIAQDPEIPAPARDYLVFNFALGLSDLDVNAVSPEVLQYLSAYQAHTLVAHEEHPGFAVPLFNVPAAAAGVRNRWDRQQASARAESLLQEPAERWIASYLAASPAGRRGFVDALEFASPEDLGRLGWSALPQLEENPGLTLVAARAGLDSGDFELLRQAISRGGGPDLSGILRASSRKLSAAESTELLAHSLQLGSDSKAALAIAHLAPAHLDQAAVRETLFSTLADRNLGAAAALVLGASADPEIQTRLRDIASKKDSPARQRAELAISVQRAGKGPER